MELKLNEPQDGNSTLEIGWSFSSLPEQTNQASGGGGLCLRFRSRVDPLAAAASVYLNHSLPLSSALLQMKPPREMPRRLANRSEALSRRQRAVTRRRSGVGAAPARGRGREQKWREAPSSGRVRALITQPAAATTNTAAGRAPTTLDDNNGWPDNLKRVDGRCGGDDGDVDRPTAAASPSRTIHTYK